VANLLASEAADADAVPLGDAGAGITRITGVDHHAPIIVLAAYTLNA